MRKIYTSIDIGTEEIKAVTVEEYNDKLNVLATACVKSRGVKKGLIIDAGLITTAIKKVIKQLESKLGTKVEQVLAVVPSNNIDINITIGEVNVTTENHLINGETIFACLQKSLKNNVPPNMEVVSVLPIEYKIDKVKKVKNPLGLEGKHLASKSVVVSVPSKNVYSVVGILENIGLEVVDVTISSIADYFSVKDKEMDSVTLSVVDIGKEKTVISIFNKGIIIKEKIINLGSSDIEDTIGFNFKTSEEESKRIKEEFGIANRKYAQSDETYEITNRIGQKAIINQYILAEMIEYKLVEMLKSIKNEINNLTNREISYIIITGGLGQMLGFNALVEDIYGHKGRVFSTNIIGIRDSKYSTAFGMIKCFISKLELREKEYTMMAEDKVEELLRTRKKMGNGSALGKIFGKIFD